MNIKQLRTYLGLTQAQFGHLVGNGVAIVNRWENGKCSPGPRSRMMINVLIDAKEYVRGHKRMLLIGDIEDATRLMFREAMK